MIETLKGLNIVVFDLEIKEDPNTLPGGWGAKDKMGISLAVLYDFRIDRYLVYTDSNMKECQERINNSALCIGFNTVTFDFPVMAATGYPVNPIKNVDILADLWNKLRLFGKDRKGFTLGTIGDLNIQRGKIGSGAHAPQLFKEGKWGDLITYNLDDVALTRDLFLLAVKQGYLDIPKGKCNLDYRELLFGVLVS